jgi:ESS family glutamate:Na+ symporter
VDYLIVATVVAIQVGIVWRYVVPIGIMSLAAGVVTTLVVVAFSKRLNTFNLERMAAIYGTVTATVSCGLLLLRTVDLDFRTSVAFEVALMNVFALPVVGGCTLLVNGPLWWHWSVGLSVLVFAGVMVLAAALMAAMGYFSGKGLPSPDRKGLNE